MPFIKSIERFQGIPDRTKNLMYGCSRPFYERTAVRRIYD